MSQTLWLNTSNKVQSSSWILKKWVCSITKMDSPSTISHRAIVFSSEATSWAAPSLTLMFSPLICKTICTLRRQQLCNLQSKNLKSQVLPVQLAIINYKNRLLIIRKTLTIYRLKNKSQKKSTLSKWMRWMIISKLTKIE